MTPNFGNPLTRPRGEYSLKVEQVKGDDQLWVVWLLPSNEQLKSRGFALDETNASPCVIMTLDARNARFMIHPFYTAPNDDGSYTDNPLGPVRTTVKFWGQAAELLHGMDFRQGDAVVATGRMGDPDAFISQKDGKAYARPVVIGDSMQIDSIVSQRIQLARERKRQDKEQAGAVADAGRTDPWTDQVDASRGEYVGDGVPRTFNGEPFEPLSGYPTPGAAPAPADPAAPDFLSTPSDFTTGNAR